MHEVQVEERFLGAMSRGSPTVNFAMGVLDWRFVNALRPSLQRPTFHFVLKRQFVREVAIVIVASPLCQLGRAHLLYHQLKELA